MAKVLVFVSSVEGREAATKLQLAAWMELAGDLDYGQAMDAARSHYLSESRRLWPADLRRVVSSAGEQFAIDAEQVGRSLSEALWSNAVLIPNEYVVELGEARMQNADRVLVALRETLEAEYGLIRRQQAVMS
jgi:hypothetical protein